MTTGTGQGQLQGGTETAHEPPGVAGTGHGHLRGDTEVPRGHPRVVEARQGHRRGDRRDTKVTKDAAGLSEGASRGKGDAA